MVKITFSAGFRTAEINDGKDEQHWYYVCHQTIVVETDSKHEGGQNLKTILIKMLCTIDHTLHL